jgi:type IV secretory pathway VirJ component
MKEFLFSFLLFLFLSVKSFSQTNKDALPVSVFKGGDSSKPVLFYISGDGGWNKFSTAFVQNLNSKGYEIVGLNAREYFWHKKNAKQTANDMSAIIASHMKMLKNKSFILIGYSFGADVMPFVISHSQAGIMDQLRHVILMSPSAKTDFEVHLSELLGVGSSSGDSVPDEINKITQPVLFVFGEKEDDFPIKNISIKNYKTEKLPGGHHYDGDPAAVCNLILPYIK